MPLYALKYLLVAGFFSCIITICCFFHCFGNKSFSLKQKCLIWVIFSGCDLEIWTVLVWPWSKGGLVVQDSGVVAVGHWATVNVDPCIFRIVTAPPFHNTVIISKLISRVSDSAWLGPWWRLLPFTSTLWRSKMCSFFFNPLKVSSYGGKLKYTISYVAGSRGTLLEDADVQIIVSTPLLTGVQSLATCSFSSPSYAVPTG